MSLGEKIYRLRTQMNLSQGDLADRLDVSRQSISKWETNGSVPELDKLVKLSEIFGVTLDELILDKQRPDAPPPPEPQVVYVEKQAPHSTKKTVGVILLCFAALVWLMVTLFGDIAAGLVLALPFLACGLICLFVRKNVGLWCIWVVYCFADLYLRFATGVNWGFAFLGRAYEGGWTIQLIVAWALLLCFGALAIVTVLRFRKTPAGSLRKNGIAAAICWAAYIFTWAILVLLTRAPVTDPSQIAPNLFAVSVSGWGRSVILVAALTFTVRLAMALWSRRKTV